MQGLSSRRPHRPFRFLISTLLLATLAAGNAGAQEQDVAATEGTGPTLAVELLTNVTSPVEVTNAGDGSGRLFIVDQNGVIRIWDGNSLLATPFLDINTLVACCGERGLLGLAFHPNYASNGYFYVDYTDNSGNTVVARYTASPPSSNVADDTSAMVILTQSQPASNHNGGKIAFGPNDGYLYIGLGDGGGAGDSSNNAQTTTTRLGKLLRIDVDGGSPFAIPADNPFVGNGAFLPEIWAYGLRNPWRYSFDRATGDLYIADVGQGSWEEIDFQPASSPGGENYGWRRMEGTHCFNPSTNCDTGNLTLPVLEYSHSLGCSVTGGYVYRGTQYLNLQGKYFYADYCSGRLWMATRNVVAGTWSTVVALFTGFNPSAFGEDEAGELYVANLGGAVYRLVDSSTTPAVFADGFESGSTSAWIPAGP